MSPVACPDCTTFCEMRPERSFWKKATDWRTKCLWLCQRIIVKKPGTMTCSSISAPQAMTMARPMAMTRSMNSRLSPCRSISPAQPSLRRPAASVSLTMSTSLPMKVKSEASTMALRKP